MSCVWVQLYSEGKDEPEGQPIKIRPAPEDVADLAEAVKSKRQVALNHCDAAALVVYPPKSSSSGSEREYKSGKKLEEVIDELKNATPPTSDDHPLIVVAPDPKKQPSGDPGYPFNDGRPPLPTTHQTEELTSVLQSMSLSLHTIKEMLPSVLSGHVVTPSTASRDRQRSASIFDAVGLALKPILVDGEYHLPVEEQKKPEWNFDFNWPKQSVDDKVLERTSYEPVLTFLRGLGLFAEDVSEGSNCIEKLLYNSDIYSPRQENPKEVRGQRVYHRHRVQGRSDLVVLNKSRQGGEILRSMVRIAIEIKTTSGYRQSTDGCMFEAQLQLIGLNAFNTEHSPPVVLSNLAKTHFVLYLAYGNGGLSYVIKKHKCATFSAAVHFALQKSNEDSISAEFSRPMTPESTE